MITNSVEFSIKGKEVCVHGYPELANCKGSLEGCGMAIFFGDNRSTYVANTRTGKIRKLSSDDMLYVEDKDIDLEAIAKVCTNGYYNAINKRVEYALVNRWDGFKNDLCAIMWTLYPDGRYFADEDGFGMEHASEENVYAIMNTELEFVEPFHPIEGDKVAEYLKKVRKRNK